jgi:ribosomal protein S18 acetylase RimI-like enzyme
VSVGLRRLRDDELPAFRESSERGYVESIQNAGGMPRVLAVEKARRDFEALWPDGRPLPDQLIYAVEEDGERVGYLWLAERENQGRKVIWIYDVEIDEAYRGRGLGRQAMLLVEEEARALGLARVELNVFGGNGVARSLYRSLGYQESAVWMGKDLE